MLKAGIFGASGYTGQELLRLLIGHPHACPVALTSRRYAGMMVSEVYPSFKSMTELPFIDADPSVVAQQCEVVFLALPHGESMRVASHFLERGVKVIDLSADYRLRTQELYETWYQTHSSPELLPQAVYGLPECYRDSIRHASLVANPGCYPTSAILALVPLVASGAIDCSSIIVDSKSGASGAGRDAKLDSLFCEVNEGFKAYKIFSHRHTPEIDQEVSAAASGEVRVVFTPHLVPANRGILTTVYATLATSMTLDDLLALYRERYAGEPFVRICPSGQYPNIAHVRGSNFCDIGCAVDEGTGKVIVVSAIDNLVKGAAGQAVQNMNIMYGFPEDSGLGNAPLFP